MNLYDKCSEVKIVCSRRIDFKGLKHASRTTDFIHVLVDSGTIPWVHCNGDSMTFKIQLSITAN